MGRAALVLSDFFAKSPPPFKDGDERFGSQVKGDDLLVSEQKKSEWRAGNNQVGSASGHGPVEVEVGVGKQQAKQAGSSVHGVFTHNATSLSQQTFFWG
jgi:hypothetical protein